MKKDESIHARLATRCTATARATIAAKATTRGISRCTEQYGDDYNLGGLLAKVSYVVEFDKPVKGKAQGYGTSNVVAEVFLPGSNPNVDPPLYTTQVEGVRAYRLEP